MTLHGCIPILCTPFADDGSVDGGGLDREIDDVLAEGARGVATLALASEGYKLTEAERDEVTRRVVARVGGRVPVVVSADGTGTEIAVDRARRAVAAGADALMVLPPSFVTPDAAGLRAYYLAVARAVEVPIIIQDAPQITRVAMGPSLWTSLARESDTIRYVKVEGTPQGQAISEAIAASGGQLAVFCGWGGLGVLDALERGAAGTMPAPNFTRLFADVQARFEAGDRQGAAARFHAELPFLLWTMQSLDVSVISAKRVFHRRGIFATPALRQPATALDAIAHRQLDGFLATRWAGE